MTSRHRTRWPCHGRVVYSGSRISVMSRVGNKPIVLAIIGPHKAGKTTLLGAWYLLLGRGYRPNDKLRFSGSSSLAGWEVVANSLRWEPGSISPAFPPHTSSRGARIPGLLHLAFNQVGAHRRDFLMTDAPRRMVPEVGG